MDLGQVECDMGLMIICIMHKFANDVRMIEESKFLLSGLVFLGNSRLSMIAIVIAQTMLGKDLVNTPAALATKRFILQGYRRVGTGITAMGTYGINLLDL
jgi:hypothetical protein